MLHVQGSSQLGTMFSWGLLLKISAFMRVKHLDFSDEMSSFLISPTALLCLLTLSACICCCLHLSSTCSQVSSSFELHMGHVIEEYPRPHHGHLIKFVVLFRCIKTTCLDLAKLCTLV